MHQGQRLRKVVDEMSISASDLANKLSVTRQSVYKYYETAKFGAGLLEKIAQSIGVDESVISGEGGNITYVPITARAGFLSGYGDQTFTLEDLPKFTLPEFEKGKYVAFTADGDSMFPTISNGDLLICQEANKEIYRGNEVYVLVTKQDGMSVKRMFATKKAAEVLLKSDNQDYSEYTIELDDIQSLWLVKAILTKNLGKRFKL